MHEPPCREFVQMLLLPWWSIDISTHSALTGHAVVTNKSEILFGPVITATPEFGACCRDSLSRWKGVTHVGSHLSFEVLPCQ